MKRWLVLGLLLAQAAGAGVLTQKHELERFKLAALRGTEPYASRRTALLTEAAEVWPNGTVSGAFTGDGGVCLNGANSTYLKEGAPDALAKAVGAVLTTVPADAATWTADAKARVLDLTDTTYPATYSGSNQCLLELSISLPVWIETAELLAELGAWTPVDDAAWKTWLKDVYRYPAWASRVRRNNWGAAGSLSAYLIAEYVGSASLAEVPPGPGSIEGPQARKEHLAKQLERIDTLWQGDSQCAVWGIQTGGGIPDEIRREVPPTSCTLDHFTPAQTTGITYQGMHTEFLVYHARAEWRTGSRALFDYKNAALLRAIRFVIANPAGSATWDENHFGGLFAASVYYNDAALDTAAAATTTFRGGRDMPYMRVFAPLASNCH